MKILTKKQQHDIGIRLIALFKMCRSMAQELPVNRYVEYADKYMTCIADIAGDVGGVEMMVDVAQKGLED